MPKDAFFSSAVASWWREFPAITTHLGINIQMRKEIFFTPVLLCHFFLLVQALNFDALRTIKLMLAALPRCPASWEMKQEKEAHTKKERKKKEKRFLIVYEDKLNKGNGSGTCSRKYNESGLLAASFINGNNIRDDSKTFFHSLHSHVRIVLITISVFCCSLPRFLDDSEIYFKITTLSAQSGFKAAAKRFRPHNFRDFGWKEIYLFQLAFINNRSARWRIKQNALIPLNSLKNVNRKFTNFIDFTWAIKTS